MSNRTNNQSGQGSLELQAIANAIRTVAEGAEKDSLALLDILRQLEALHREIRDGVFQASLPDNRQELYALLRQIETEGGWPYIERMRLQSFISNLAVEPDATPATE